MTYDPNRPLYSSTEQPIEQTTDAAYETVDKAHQAATSAVDKAYDAATGAVDKAQQVATDVRDRAGDIGAQAAERADAATTTVGARMTDVAQTIREKAPTAGPVANVADTAAQTLERAGTYLQDQDLQGMQSDLESLVRRYPIQSLLVGLGLGYLLARSGRR